jgi:3-methyladenine DNA glycosylase Mpg
VQDEQFGGGHADHARSLLVATACKHRPMTQTARIGCDQAEDWTWY